MTAEEILTKAGVRPTHVRDAVLKRLYEAGCPLSHGEIAAHPGMKRYDRVTIYRTLYTLEGAGLVHTVQGIDGAWRFCAHPPDRTGCPGNHPHFLCLKCGKMQCLTGQRLPWVEVPERVRVKGKQLVIYGICTACGTAEERNKNK